MLLNKVIQIYIHGTVMYQTHYDVTDMVLCTNVDACRDL